MRWIEARAGWLALALVALATLRIASTYTVFNHTHDEIAHIACGMEWLDKGRYQYEDQHPPLTRVVAALLPYLDGSRGFGKETMWNEGAAILYAGGRYDHVLSLARTGNLAFFWLASAVVFFWAKRAGGGLPAVLATLLFTLLPPVLAHAGLATTDLGLTACLAAAFLMLYVWAESPSWRNSALLGLAGGATILAKFSGIPFFGVSLALAAGAYFIMRPKDAAIGLLVQARIVPLLAATGVAVLTILIGYRFSPGPLISGIETVMRHNAEGHPAYLLGEYSKTGWWYYYFVVLSVKTPIAFAILGAAGLWTAWTTRNRALMHAIALVAGVLLFSSVFSQINIGVRHVLPVFIGGAVLAGAGTAWLLRQPSGAAHWSTAALLVWLSYGSLASHPDYIPYFNLLAGDAPEKIVVDSDLDWGQDAKRLSRRLRELGAAQVAFDPFVVAHYELVHDFPPIQPLDPHEPLPGWNAVSLTMLKLDRMGLKDEHREIIPWPEKTPPMERVGETIRLYYRAPAAAR